MKKYFILSFLALLATAFNAFSATLTVTNSNDNGSGSLRERIASANSGDTIIFATNVNHITLTSGHISIIDKNLTINGGTGNTRVTLDGNNHSRIFDVYSSLYFPINIKHTININNLIFTKGTSGLSNGGAVYVFNSTFTAISCTFSKNSSLSNGGAIYTNDADFTADGCTFTENSAKDGGAVYVIYVLGSSSFTATRCVFLENSSSNSAGAVFIYRTTFIAINCTFSKNFAQSCGGAVDGLSAGLINTFTALNCTFSENSTNSSAGAIHVYNITIYLYHCTFDGNQAPKGNAIYNEDMGTLYSYNCVYTGNTPQIEGNNIIDGDNLIEGVNAIVTRNYVFGTNQFNGRYITPLPNARAAKKLDNTIQVPAGMSVDEILNKLAKDQRGNPRPTE